MLFLMMPPSYDPRRRSYSRARMSIESVRRFMGTVGMALAVLALITGCASGSGGPGADGSLESGLPPSTASTIQVATTEAERINPNPTAATEPTSPVVPATTISERASPPSTEAPAEEVTWSLPSEQASVVLELMGKVESLRERRFLTRPAVIEEPYGGGATGDASNAAGQFPEDLEGRLELLELLVMSADPIPSNPGPSEPYFDFDQRTIVLPEGADLLDEYQQLVLVGELVHALTAQHNPELFEGLGHGFGDSDGRAARKALIEGEASVVQALYLDSLTPEHRSEAARLSAEQPRTVVDNLPDILREISLFPHRAGSLLATHLYRLGGTAALDQALDRPPQTTEHVLHLDKYRRLEPAIVIPPLNVTADSYVLEEKGSWGEHRWQALLGRYNPQVEASRAAEGWGGDRYEFHRNPVTGDLVFVARYVGDSFADESEVNSALRTMLSSGIGARSSQVRDTITEWENTDGYALLSWDLDAITLVISSDPIVGRATASQLGYAV